MQNLVTNAVQQASQTPPVSPIYANNVTVWNHMSDALHQSLYRVLTLLIAVLPGILAFFVALVIFAAWNPVRCLWASMLFGGAQSIGAALQGIGISSNYYLWNASPYILTLLVMIITCSPKQTLAGAPGALGTNT